MQLIDWSSIFFILEGIITTLKYSITSCILGFCLGAIIACCKISNKQILKISASIYTSIFRGTPLLIQLMIIHLTLPGIFGVKFSVFASGIIAFSLNSAAYVSEVIKSGINSVDKGQFEAAISLGIPYNLMMKDIILPQAIRNILPSLINELINLIKESAIISVIGEMDLMRRAQLVSSDTYDYLTPMLTAAVGYYILVMIISSLARVIEHKMSRSYKR